MSMIQISFHKMIGLVDSAGENLLLDEKDR